MASWPSVMSLRRWLRDWYEEHPEHATTAIALTSASAYALSYFWRYPVFMLPRRMLRNALGNTAAALGAARYIRDAPAIIRKRRIEDTALVASLIRECADPERLDALVDMALASGATVKAVVGGALHSHTKRGAVDALKVLGRRLLREDAAECSKEAAACLRIALERCGGDDAGWANG